LPELLYIFVFVLVLIGCFFVTKWISVRSYTLVKGRNLRVIERIPVDRDKSIILLARGEKVYLIGVAPNSINVLDTFSKDEIREIEPMQVKIPFDKVLRRFVNEKDEED
jgi:flagellar biogenesis protein FliO